MALLIAAASLLALAHASGPQASCAVGQQCAAGEQDDTGMLQKSSQMMQLNRHEQMSVRTTPTNDAECKDVKGINTGLPIVYDSSCPGLCCFEDQPCRYNNTGCYSAALAQQRVRTTPTNDAECKAVKGINTGLPIVYDSSCPGLCCFEDQPCRYNNTGCYSAALAQQKVRTTPTNDAECKAVKGINTGLPIVYDSSCPGLCCFEDQPCRYNNTGCYSAALAQQKVRTTPTNDAEDEDDAHERRRVQGREGHQHGPAHRLRLQLPRPVLLRGPAVQVQQHGLLLRSLGAAEGEDDAHERRRVQGREGHQHGPAHRLRLQLPRPVLLRGPAVQVQQHGLLLRSLGAAEGEDDAHERRRVQGREGHQHGPAHRLRLQLPRPVLLRGPAVQVQQHGLLLRSLGAAEGEDDAHERRGVQGREGHQHGPAHRLRLQLPRPVLLRGPAVQVQQHGLLLRSLGAAEGEDHP
ncbi:unnamed protein product [Prorocentrum cordatum]|uniref:SREBP regulating gene protein n=1 Tax=Prorocentrum cordatum TaxID=2364126 RepID=A0ABN9RUP0_9DINO|nr:unnamed protein product [Polarella glacialis]